MTGFIAGAVLIYAVGVVQVFRSQREKRTNPGLGPDLGVWNDLKIALRWPVIVGPQT